MDQKEIASSPRLGISTENLWNHHGPAVTAKRPRLPKRMTLIAVCATFSFCTFLIAFSTQYRPFHPVTIDSEEASPDPLESLLGTDFEYETNQQQSTAYSHSMTAKMERILEAERKEIDRIMEGFQYPDGINQLSDLTPETNGTPIRSIIFTSWRSGSTFFGDILNSLPGTYYHFEPLLSLGGPNEIRENADLLIALKNVKNLLHCNYFEMEDYLVHGKTHTYLFRHNGRLWSNCKGFCWRSEFLTPFCKLFPLQSLKSVRLRLAAAEQLINDESLNVRVVLLVRDPRGTMQSRKHHDWCRTSPDCGDPTVLCNDLVSDYETAQEFLKKYPTRVRTLRYEDLSKNPYEIAEEILHFYGLPFHPKVIRFLDSHTKTNKSRFAFSTYRDSLSAPFHWKQELTVEEMKNIQDSCAKAMDLWGYRKIENFTDFQDTFDPIILPPPFS